MRKLSKKLVAACMTAAMMLTMVPAAFAAEPETTTARPAPEEVLEATITPANGIASIADNGIEGAGTKSAPYQIDSASDFQALMNQTEDINNLEQLYVEITDDIDLSTVEEPDIWNGYLMYFYGHITGKDVTKDGVTRQPIISGMSGDRYLIYGWFGGSISNLTFDMKGNAATINYICGKLNGAFQNCTMNDIEIISTDENGNDTPILLPTNNQANYAPFTYSMYGNFTMSNCVNNADMNGVTYASVFVGYYPLDKDGQYNFVNCVNNGEISLRHAGMFFGNNSGFVSNQELKEAFAFHENNVQQNKIQFSGCKNNGVIQGTDSAELFSGRPAGQNDEVSEAYETYLRSDAVGCMGDEDSVRVLEDDLGINLTYDTEGNLTATLATEEPSSGYVIDHYVVSVYTYLNSYALSLSSYDWIYNGTILYGTEQTIDADVSNPTVDLKYYGVCDYPATTEGLTFEDPIGGLDVVSYNGAKYYWVDNLTPYIVDSEYEYYWFVDYYENNATKAAPNLVTISAYTADGTLLSTVEATATVD